LRLPRFGPKRKDLQPVFSFKLRGAYCKKSRLSPEQLSRGVIAAWAGNHAQRVAIAAQKLNVKATIVMPRPGTLLTFLSRLGQRWNVWMFHYLNHGAAYGCIFVGIQVRKTERRQFKQGLDRINFRYWEETANRASQLHLGNHSR